MAKLVLGAEHDGALIRATKRALRKLGARRTLGWWGLGGSQEVSSETWKSPVGPILLEAETYEGFTITGPEDFIARVATLARERLRR